MPTEMLHQRKSWIYKIRIGSKFYIGSTINVKARESSHFTSLKSGKHSNCKLQRAYNKRQEFEFQIIEECPETERWKRESHWIAEYNSILKGYNIATVDITKDALEDESLFRTICNNTQYIELYPKIKNLLVKYFDTELPARTQRSVHGIFHCLRVRENANKDIKVQHWFNAFSKIEDILEKWKTLPEGTYRWHDSFYPEDSGWGTIQNNPRHNFTNRPYEFLEALFMNSNDPLFKIIIKKLHSDGLLRLKGYEKYHVPLYGPMKNNETTRKTK